MQINIRGKDYPAQYLTDLNYLPLGNLFIEDDGSFTLAEINDYEALSEQQRLKLTRPMMKKLCDPVEKSGVAQAIAAIFPAVPGDLVSYKGGEFTLNVTLSELLNIAITCSNELQSQMVKPKIEEDEVALLKAEVQRLKGFLTIP